MRERVAARAWIADDHRVAYPATPAANWKGRYFRDAAGAAQGAPLTGAVPHCRDVAGRHSAHTSRLGGEMRRRSFINCRADQADLASAHGSAAAAAAPRLRMVGIR